MAQANDKLQHLDSSHVSPSPGSVPMTSLRLTFFDLPWFSFPNIQRLFFYEFPYPALFFMDTILPQLKHSLSLTLQHFFPFAARIMCPPPPGKPYLHYKDGDFVTFMVVESSADFNHVIANYPRDANFLHPFASQLPTEPVAEDGTRVLPLLAFQVTLFPNSGICIGCNYCHLVGDGKTFMHFMRSWSSVHRAGGDLTCLEKSLPLCNKDVIKDPDRVEALLLKDYWNWATSKRENNGPTSVAAGDKVRATFLLGRTHVEKLKLLVTAANPEQYLHISTFVVTCAFIWVCLIKSKESSTSSLSDDDEDDKFYYFQFPFDYRNRLEFSIPETYFGNCLRPVVAEVKKSELIGENGILLAAKAIGNKVKETQNLGLSDAESWIANLVERIRSGRFTSVSGSPKFYVYDIDFGWGRPSKVELVHIDSNISLAESRDDKGGIEVCVALTKKQMDEFVLIFEQSLKLL